MTRLGGRQTVPKQRIEGRPERAAPLWLRALYLVQRRLYGRVLEPTRVWARAPAALRGFVHLFAAVDRRASPIPAGLRSLLMVKVSQINACSYCVDINGSMLERRGVSLEKALALSDYGFSSLYSHQERAALDFAVAMTCEGSAVTEDLFARLRRHFDDDAIVELAALVGLQNASSKFNAALAIPSQGFCPALSPEAPREL